VRSGNSFSELSIELRGCTVHDWPALVRARLDDLGIAPGERDLVVAELAAHLEDVHALHLSRGLCDEEAATAALGEVTDWKKLSRRIQDAKRKEELMNDRTKQLWLPGLVCFATSMIWLMLLQFAGVQPNRVHVASIDLPMFYIPWLAGLPIFGALAAYLSRKAGARRSVIFVVTVFPCLMFLISILLWVLPVSLFSTNDPASAYIRAHFSVSTVFSICVLLMLPTVPLLLGALPFLRMEKTHR
jgi:hypothetical protein